jgi:DNA repair exonuclease SbcCD ATPase subunit
MTKVFEEIMQRIRKMKTREEYIETIEATKKTLINQVNKTKQEVEKEAKKLYSELQQNTWRMTCRRITIKAENFNDKNKKKSTEQYYRKIEIKPQVCTSLTLKSSRVSSITNTNKPVFQIRINEVIKETTYEKVSRGLLFKNVKFLPTIDLGNKKIPKGVKEYDFISSMNISQEALYRDIAKHTKYINKGILQLATIRAVKYTPINDKVKEKEQYIEKLNRKIKGARQLNHHYNTMYDQAIAGIKTLEQLEKYNKELDEKVEHKIQLLKGLNTRTTENIKNNKAKINALKNQITDLKKKKKKNVEKYRETKQWVNNARQRTHYWERRGNLINEAANKINQIRREAVNTINNKKKEAYNKIRNAGYHEGINVNFNGIGSDIDE